MSDIFREVDEDIRQEKYRRLWNRFGFLIIGFAVLIVVGTGGYRGWLYWQETQSRNSGDTFLNAISLSEAGDMQEAAALYGELETAVGGYPALAQMRIATDLANAGETAEALAQFDALSRNTALDQSLRDVAALRAAYLAVDIEGYTDVADRIEGLTGDTGAYRGAAREILALSAWKQGDFATAQKWISDLEQDPETPVEINQRVTLLSDIIRSHTGDLSTANGDDAQ